MLQREIAQTRGVSVEQLNSAFRSGHHDDRQSNGGDESRTDGQGSTGAGGKRKYRRHPKVETLNFCRGDVARLFDSPGTYLANFFSETSQADENAPERPPSAYVIFSNSERHHSCPEKYY